MSVNVTDSGSSASTIKDSGISAQSTYNYSIDTMKKAAFTDELNSVLILKNSVDFNPIIDYLKNRIDEINAKYK